MNFILVRCMEFRVEFPLCNTYTGPRSPLILGIKMMKLEFKRCMFGAGRAPPCAHSRRRRISCRSEQAHTECDIAFMSLAIEQARKGALSGEVPIGAVIVQKGAVVAEGAFSFQVHHWQVSIASCHMVYAPFCSSQ